jgi:non-ribosomal peptide synthetase component E (peptide arylation enzyme)
VIYAGATIEPAAVPTHLDGWLAHHKWPARIMVWPERPCSGYGKVPKREAQRLLEAGERPGGGSA